MFIWGLSPEEAKVKMEHIYRAVCSAAPWKVICVWKANTISIHTNYPYRPIQIVLRLYQSPAEILAGFDVDAACCAYDGERVWVNPRSLTALVRQANTVDMTRRSPSYEIRLAKYAERGFEVYVPSLIRHKINPSVYAKDLPAFPNGLARLLVLETAYYRPSFYECLQYPKMRIMTRKVGSNGGTIGDQYHAHRGSTGLVCKNDPEDMLIGNTEELVMSNYDSSWGWAQIPYGPSWHADKIRSMISKTDASINSPHNPYNNEGDFHHRHVFFAGSMKQCLGTFCLDCANAEPHPESGTIGPGSSMYIQGPVSFLMANPGRQLITGSFRPIDVGDWAREAYESPAAFSDAMREVNECGFDPDSTLGEAESAVETCRCC
ncbi:hypothetical protein CPB84DRAFT_1853842 [Gymnopilus junonius]|uniref:Uncharacterized protein n=1 Tax=Gymnopilus junonius TaxID=109634 RepID=A0A9P5N885_GYMJU|nr:hypothetical protein CPB84DRAFT_1853842 [Gymnopilus junonius]